MRAQFKMTLATACVLAAPGLAGCRTVSEANLKPAAKTAAKSLSVDPYAYSGGTASQGFALPFKDVKEAAHDALEDLRITQIEGRSDAADYVFTGVTASRHNARVVIRDDGDHARVNVRVGWFGDEPLSRAVLDRIGIRLGTLPPQVVPEKIPSESAEHKFLKRIEPTFPQFQRPAAAAAGQQSKTKLVESPEP